MTTRDEFRVAVLHQAAATPAIGGVLKPAKPGKVVGMPRLLRITSHSMGVQGDTRTAVPISRTLCSWNLAKSEIQQSS